MNILILAEVSAYKVEGGSHRMLREQAIILKKRGHNISLIVREPVNNPDPQSTFENITEYHYKVDRTSTTAFLISSVLNSVRVFDRILHDGFHPDIVLIDQSLAGFGPIFFRKNCCACWIYQSFSLSHEEYLTRNTPGTSLLNRFMYYLHVKARFWIERWTIRRAKSVIIMSEFMKQRVIASHSIPVNKIYLLPGAADTSRFRPPADKDFARTMLHLSDNRILLFTIRNLVPRMGLENLLKAIAELGPQCDGTHLVIAGKGPLRTSLEQLSQSLNIADKVTFTGYLPDNELPLYFQAADLVMMPTLTLEGFGMVTVEALACATPVLGTPVGATPEILAPIDPRLLSKGYDSHSIAEALGKILQIIRNDPAEWQKISQRSLESVEKLYNWNIHGELLEAILLSQITRHSERAQEITDE